jgi:uncharacterized protein (UPF0264 family)
MKLLISVVSPQEARVAWDCGADIIDVKNIAEGSLGASFPWTVRAAIESIPDRNVAFSATLGDLPFKPGTASLAARGAASCGVKYVKAGLHGAKTHDEGVQVMRAVVGACRDYDASVAVVTAGYADYRRSGGLNPLTLVEVAADAQSDLVMLDTLTKDGRTLFDHMTEEALAAFVDRAHAQGLAVALAGSIRVGHLESLAQMGTDVVGVRGAICDRNDRAAVIDPIKAREFVWAASVLAQTRDGSGPRPSIAAFV